MNKTQTVKDADNLEYRKKRLRRKLQQVELLLSGGSCELLPLIRGEDGRWAETRGQSLIRELLDNTLAPAQEEAAEQELSQKERELFSDFLYCALRAMESPLPVSDRDGPLNGTWAELAAFAADTAYRSRYELYYDECFYSAAGFFGCMDRIYAALTKTEAVSRVSPADIEIMRGLFRQEIEEQEQLPKELPTEALAAFSEPADISNRTEEREETAELAAWLDSFAEKDAFCQAYLRFRESFFACGAGRFLKSLTERAVDLYLDRNNVSRFLSDDTFFLAYGLLDRAERQLRLAVRGDL